MSWALAGFGWLGVLLCLARMRTLARGRVLVGEAAHELRGSGTALSLAMEAVGRQPGGRRLVLILESELERLRAALDDLDAARELRVREPEARMQRLDRVARSAALAWRPAAVRAGRPVHLRWEAGDVPVEADRGRLAQAFGNLLANAIEHGRGPVVVRARRRGPAVRVEITDRGRWGGSSGGEASRRLAVDREADRGHGLAIARRAVAQTGGSLTVESTEQGTTAAIELPVARR